MKNVYSLKSLSDADELSLWIFIKHILFSWYFPNRQSCITEAKTDHVYKKVEQGKETNPIKMYYKMYIVWVILIVKILVTPHM